MKHIALALTLLALASCGAAPNAQSTTPAAAPAPFSMPMDPGQITCAQLANPTALAEAANWAMGHYRAQKLSGARLLTPEPTSVQGAFIIACDRTPTLTLAQVLPTLPF